MRLCDSLGSCRDGHADAAVRCVHPARTRETPVHSRGSRHGPDHRCLRQAPGNDDAGRGSSHSASFHFTSLTSTHTHSQVRFTRPSAEVLERPSPNASIVIVNINFDLVDPETLTPYPLDRIYNHHLVIHGWETGDTTDGDARTEIREAISEILPGAVELATAAGLLSSDAATSTGIAAAMRGTLGAAIRRRRGHSSLLTPCGVGVGVAGAGAEWRGQQLNVSRTYKDDPFLNGSRLWVEPGNTTWGVNAHLIDLRDVENLADAVQCNCAAYAKRTPGTPQNW